MDEGSRFTGGGLLGLDDQYLTTPPGRFGEKIRAGLEKEPKGYRIITDQQSERLTDIWGEIDELWPDMSEKEKMDLLQRTALEEKVLRPHTLYDSDIMDPNMGTDVESRYKHLASNEDEGRSAIRRADSKWGHGRVHRADNTWNESTMMDYEAETKAYNDSKKTKGLLSGDTRPPGTSWMRNGIKLGSGLLKGVAGGAATVIPEMLINSVVPESRQRGRDLASSLLGSGADTDNWGFDDDIMGKIGKFGVDMFADTAYTLLGIPGAKLKNQKKKGGGLSGRYKGLISGS